MISDRARRLVEDLQEPWDMHTRLEIAQRHLDDERDATLVEMAVAVASEPADESADLWGV